MTDTNEGDNDEPETRTQLLARGVNDAEHARLRTALARRAREGRTEAYRRMIDDALERAKAVKK